MADLGLLELFPYLAMGLSGDKLDTVQHNPGESSSSSRSNRMTVSGQWRAYGGKPSGPPPRFYSKDYTEGVFVGGAMANADCGGLGGDGPGACGGDQVAWSKWDRGQRRKGRRHETVAASLGRVGGWAWR